MLVITATSPGTKSSSITWINSIKIFVLEWAMKHGLWGHALFLASKLDKRTYANVMMRFANGLTMNDPLQTLYQLLSGKMPAVVTVRMFLKFSYSLTNCG